MQACIGFHPEMLNSLMACIYFISESLLTNAQVSYLHIFYVQGKQGVAVISECNVPRHELGLLTRGA